MHALVACHEKHDGCHYRHRCHHDEDTKGDEAEHHAKIGGKNVLYSSKEEREILGVDQNAGQS